jgi:hypothetical protein
MLLYYGRSFEVSVVGVAVASPVIVNVPSAWTSGEKLPTQTEYVPAVGVIFR